MTLNELILRTGVWYDERHLKLSFPAEWDVVTHWPSTPGPMKAAEISACLRNPHSGPAIAHSAAGKQAPLVIVDDLARPTPAGKILPHILDELQRAGIPKNKVKILVATGTHGHQDPKALAQKLGAETLATCSVFIHSDRARARFMGRTSFGTPVFVNPLVARSDLVIGVGGVYPQHTVGFGGGSKLALGVLGRRSIVNLHYGNHGSVAGRYAYRNSFRADLDEIAAMIGLRHSVTVHINGLLEVVHVIVGDPALSYPEAAEFTLKHYQVPRPDDADVVIANTYPSDISYTFMRKGFKPLRLAPVNAIKIAIGSIPEGIGRHGIFQQAENPHLNHLKALYFRLQTLSPQEILKKIVKNLRPRPKIESTGQDNGPTGERDADGPLDVWLYRPSTEGNPLPPITGVRLYESWDRLLDAISAIKEPPSKLRVRIYPCASLLCIADRTRSEGPS